jgi:quercetin dioxygenase-like cupin family protein
MTLAYWDVTASSPLSDHAHLHEQVTSVIEGEFELTVEGDTRRLSAGSVVIIPPNARHSGKALTDCRLIDVFYPKREDYIPGNHPIAK